MVSIETAAHDEVPASLRRQWAELHMRPLWESVDALQDNEREAPSIWRWSQTRPMLHETGLVSSPAATERRVMIMVNPSAVRNRETTAGLISGNLQLLLPGERARPHRHAMTALRFVLEGSGTTTFVDGKACPMERGDLILTPGWTWHEHVNAGTIPTVWVDILDITLHRALNTTRFEPGPAHDIPAQSADDMFASPGVLPCGIGHETRTYSPLFRYPWSGVVSALELASRMNDGSRRVRYVNPLFGGSALHTIDCYVLELQPSADTTPVRDNASTLFTVVEGDGVSTIDDTSIAWATNDSFTVPQNARVVHRAGASGARLFEVTDREVYRMLGVYHSELLS